MLPLEETPRQKLVLLLAEMLLAFLGVAPGM